MDQPPSPQPRFAWVRKQDGRLVPFEADKISRDLFAAGERTGKPDAFLARELTDSVLHFLDSEIANPIPTTCQIADLVVKVVRELGQPALAVAFAEQQTRTSGDVESADSVSVVAAPGDLTRTGPVMQELVEWVHTAPPPDELVWKTAGSSLRDFSLHEVFTRDLVAAQATGLLSLGGLEAPLELSGCVLSSLPASEAAVVEAIETARRTAGEFLALDGPEYVLAGRGSGSDAANAFAQAVKLGLRLMRLGAVINLNCSEAPPHLGELAMGPLFQSFQTASEPALLHSLAETLLEQFLQSEPSGPCVRVDWHLGRGDFAPEADGTLLRLARRALESASLAFTFDRPRRVIALAEGLDRLHSAALLTVRVHLPQLIEQSGPEIDTTLFVKKLGSLARLALSAGKQKRDFLRRHAHTRPLLAGSFLLDRARLVVVPIGMEAAAQMLLGRGLCSGGSAPEFARQIAQRLCSVLGEDGRACLMDTCVDSAQDWSSGTPPADHRGPESFLRDAAGLTAWDPSATAKSQLRAASVLQGVAGAGTATVLLPDDALPSPDEVVELLHYAWKQTELVRLRLARTARPSQQLAVPWERQ